MGDARPRVLIADDDADTGRALVPSLESWGYHVTRTADGRAAWRELAIGPQYSLALVDWSVPYGDGAQLCARIRTCTELNKLRVLALCSPATIRTYAGRLDDLVDDYVAVPPDLEALRARVRALLRRRSARERAKVPPLPRSVEEFCRMPREGSIVGGRYRLESFLGAGGVGTVWAGHHLLLRRTVALKFLRPDRHADQRARMRLLLEARAASALPSDRIVRVLDFGQTEDAVPFFAMDLLTGSTLADDIRRRGRLPLRDVEPMISQVCAGLQVAHDHGVIHRDLTAENVFLVRREDRPPAPTEIDARIIDFGCAKRVREQTPWPWESAADARSPRDRLTDEGELVGTLAYLAPESILGNAPLGFQTDIWSLGVCAYVALTGRLPFSGATHRAMATSICHLRPVPPSRLESSLPPAVDAWFKRACAKDPAARYPSPRETADALHAAAVRDAG